MADAPTPQRADPDDAIPARTSHSRRRLLRHIRTAVLCLLAGAILNAFIVIIVSLAFPVVRKDLSMDERFFTIGDAQTQVAVRNRFGGALYCYGYYPNFDWPYGGAMSDLPVWLPPNQNAWEGDFIAHGWPFVAAYCETHTFFGAFVHKTRGAWVTPWVAFRDPAGRPSPLIVPHLPIWRGIITNTLFYAVVLWSVWMIVKATRRAFRYRRGLCPACAYDLRGADHVVCPECGKAGRYNASTH